jgi:hypothetical protein
VPERLPRAVCAGDGGLSQQTQRLPQRDQKIQRHLRLADLHLKLAHMLRTAAAIQPLGQVLW